MTRGRHGDHVGVIVLGNPQSMNRAEMAVAFGRRCGFASGRLLGATGPRMEPYNWKASAAAPAAGRWRWVIAVQPLVAEGATQGFYSRESRD